MFIVSNAEMQRYRDCSLRDIRVILNEVKNLDTSMCVFRSFAMLRMTLLLLDVLCVTK